MQQALNLQQTYSTALCDHVNVIFSRITKLETEIQNLTEKFKMEQDDVQIDALHFDPDVDRPDTQWVHHTTMVASVHELLTSPDPESVDASNTQEEIADRDQLNTSHPSSEDSHRPHNLPPTSFRPSACRYFHRGTTGHNPFDKIPQLEEEEN